MSAKQQRPFYVFAAVAAICCFVLVTGVRASEPDGHRPVFAGASVADARAATTRYLGGPVAPGPELAPGVTGGDGTGSVGDVGDVGAVAPDPDQPAERTPADGADAESGPTSGLAMLPPVTVNPGEVALPVGDDQVAGKHRGEKGKKKGKDKQGDEAEADAESEDEVDPNAYGMPETEDGTGSEPDDSIDETPAP